MEIRIRLFAAARQLAGALWVSVTVPDFAAVAELKAALTAAVPALERSLPSMRIAVNEEYADDHARIAPGAEVAVIPPVSGG